MFLFAQNKCSSEIDDYNTLFETDISCKAINAMHIQQKFYFQENITKQNTSR